LGEVECIQGFGRKVRRKETIRKTQTSVGDNIKMNLREIGWDGMGCINLAEDRDQWQPLVNMVRSLQVP
jgi:hypothetical protein